MERAKQGGVGWCGGGSSRCVYAPEYRLRGREYACRKGWAGDWKGGREGVYVCVCLNGRLQRLAVGVIPHASKVIYQRPCLQDPGRLAARVPDGTEALC